MRNKRTENAHLAHGLLEVAALSIKAAKSRSYHRCVAAILAITLMASSAHAIPPNANAGPDQSVDEESNVQLDGSSSTDDGVIVSYAWSQTVGTSVSLIGSNTANPTFVAPTRLVPQGPEDLTFQLTVTDDGAEVSSDTIVVTVNPVNADPSADAGQNQTVNESSPVALDGTGSSDGDGSIASYAWTQTAGTGVTLSGANTASPTFTSPNLPGNSGDTLTFQLQVTDNEGATDTDTVDVNVDQVNEPPVITGQNPISMDEDTSREITLADLAANDPDDAPGPLTVSVQDGTNYSRVGNTITPATDFSGNLTVPVMVNDGAANSNQFNLSVTVNPVNDAPQIVGHAPLNTLEDVSLPILVTDLTIVDPDNNPGDFTLTLQGGANYTLSGNSVTPAQDFNGNLSVPATVSDGLLSSPVFNLIVSVGAVNDLPFVVTPIGGQNAVELSPFNLDISGNFGDPDGEALTFTATGLPPSGNISLNQNTGRFTGTPQIADTTPSVYNVTVRATDGGGQFATDTFVLTISALDRANISLSIVVSPSPAMVSDQLRWEFTARNPMGPQAGANIEISGSFFGNGLDVSSASGCTISPAGGQTTNFSCAVGALPVGGTGTAVLNTTTTVGGDVTAFAVAAGANPIPIDPNPDDNSSQVAVGVAESFSAGAVRILGNSLVRSVASGDVNNDGENDIIVGTAAGQPVQVYLGDGYRGYAASPITVPDNGANVGVALADFDNNGTLDLVVANGSGQSDMVYSNDGSGNFSIMATLGATFGQDVAVGDFDDNGNADIAVATVQGNPIYLGNGSGGFTLHATLGSANSTAVAVGRLNNDSRDDVIFANIGSPSRSWTKDSGAGFTSRDQISIGDATSVALADLGGNNRLDAVFGRIAADIGDIPANPVLINNGSANFGAPIENLGNSPTNDVEIGDVNRDGVLDLVFINDSGVHQIWYAAGGSYELHSEQIIANGAVRGVIAELGDIDVADDGGVDLVMGGPADPGAGVYLNDGFGNLGRGDAVPPVLTLNGADPLDVPSNTSFVDPGASAEDNIDGNISASVVSDNPVNTSVIGVYTVTYNVMDFAGNNATPITRTVNVIPSAGSGGSGGGGAFDHWLLIVLGLLAGPVAGAGLWSQRIRVRRYQKPE